jgi:hypothetical protein
MITVRIHRDEHDDKGVQTQLMCIPRIGETISCPNTDGEERDYRVTGVNHWIKQIEGHLQQVEVVIFCQPSSYFNLATHTPVLENKP